MRRAPEVRSFSVETRSRLRTKWLTAGVVGTVAVGLDRTKAGEESNDAAAGTCVEAAAHAEAAVDLMVEMACAEVGEEVALACSWQYSREVVPLGAPMVVVERVVDVAVDAAANARAR
jgi:hypothetical protein